MRQITIGRKKYTIKLIHFFKNKKQRMGEIDYDAREITLASHAGNPPRKLTRKEMVETFWHEAIHAILDDMQSDLTYDERFVKGMAKRLTKLIQSEADSYDKDNMVTQRPKGLRELREKVPRSTRP